MRAWNYLSSLLSQKGVLHQSILVKSLHLIIDFFEKSNQQHGGKNHGASLQNFYTEIANQEVASSQTSLDPSGDRDLVMLHYSKMFHHCFVQGML
jgi:hypothetical protein